jgi:hypothetical protein
MEQGRGRRLSQSKCVKGFKRLLLLGGKGHGGLLRFKIDIHACVFVSAREGLSRSDGVLERKRKRGFLIRPWFMHLQSPEPCGHCTEGCCSKAASVVTCDKRD